jgi:RHS repeat-associated protein
VTLITDGDGDEVQRREYDAWGQVISTQPVDPAYRARYTYTGQEVEVAGLMNYGARLYDPVAGSFIQADSVIPDLYDSQALNRYAYARDNPIANSDPTGHSWLPAIAGGLVGGLVTGLTGNPVFGAAAGGAVYGAMRAAENGGGATEIFAAGLVGALFGATSGALGMAFPTAMGIAGVGMTGYQLYRGNTSLGELAAGMVAGYLGYQAGTGMRGASGSFAPAAPSDGEALSLNPEGGVDGGICSTAAECQGKIDYWRGRLVLEGRTPDFESATYNPSLPSDRDAEMELIRGKVHAWVGPGAMESEATLVETLLHEYAHKFYYGNTLEDHMGVNHYVVSTAWSISAQSGRNHQFWTAVADSSWLRLTGHYQYTPDVREWYITPAP